MLFIVKIDLNEVTRPTYAAEAFLVPGCPPNETQPCSLVVCTVQAPSLVSRSRPTSIFASFVAQFLSVRVGEVAMEVRPRILYSYAK